MPEPIDNGEHALRLVSKGQLSEKLGWLPTGSVIRYPDDHDEPSVYIQERLPGEDPAVLHEADRKPEHWHLRWNVGMLRDFHVQGTSATPVGASLDVVLDPSGAREPFADLRDAHAKIIGPARDDRISDQLVAEAIGSGGWSPPEDWLHT